MRITLPSGCPAELARPDGRPARGVVLVPDIMGLRPLFDELCARLADENQWVVCAPEPYPGREGMAIEQRLATPLDDEARLRDIVDADADHGFVHDPSRPAHRADDARDAWSRALRFLSD